MKPKKIFQCQECGKKYKGWSAWMNKHIGKFEHYKFQTVGIPSGKRQT